jgi:dTDP-4-dehydrorhamnose 3,5-epimerase
MQVTPLEIPDVKLVEPARHGDARGFFSETYSRQRYEAAGIAGEFVQDNHSLSGQVGVVRGLHFQIAPHAQGKLVRVVKGAILDVAVDIRHGSPTFGRHVTVELSAANWRQLWIPVGFAHGFCTLEPDTEVVYKVTDYYAPECDRGILWNDPALAVPWPVGAGEATVSPKDRALPPLAQLPEHFSCNAPTSGASS